MRYIVEVKALTGDHWLPCFQPGPHNQKTNPARMGVYAAEATAQARMVELQNRNPDAQYRIKPIQAA